MRLAIVSVTIGVLAVIGYATGVTTISARELSEWVHRFSGLAPLVFIALFAALNTIGLPVPVLVTVGGAAFGVIEGAAVTWLAMWATACVQFVIARRLGGDDLRQRLAGQLGRFGSVFERHGVLAVVAGRMLPGPFSELNMAAGLTPLSFRDFALGTLVGCAPKAIAWSAIGASVG